MLLPMRRSVYDIHLSPFVGQDLSRQCGKTSRNYVERRHHVSVGIKIIFIYFLSCYKVIAPDMTMNMNQVS